MWEYLLLYETRSCFCKCLKNSFHLESKSLDNISKDFAKLKFMKMHSAVLRYLCAWERKNERREFDRRFGGTGRQLKSASAAVKFRNWIVVEKHRNLGGVLN